MIEIDFGLTYRTALAVVEQAGKEYVYTDIDGDVAPHATCVYVFENSLGECKVGCFVGRFFNHLGIDLSILDQSGDSEDLIVALVEDGIIDIDDKSRKFLKVAQIMQDKGVPYGPMFKSAYSIVNIYTK